MTDFTTMGNDEIGEFCVATGRKLAKDLYQVAKAIQVVHQRLGQRKGEFKAWRERYVPYLSKATVYRYLSVAKLDPADIGTDEGITDLYRRFHILPAKHPAEPDDTVVCVTGKVVADLPRLSAAASPLDDLIGLLASQPGAKKHGFTPEALGRMPEATIRDLAGQFLQPAGPTTAVTPHDGRAGTGLIPAGTGADGPSPEEEFDRRDATHAHARIVARERAKRFPTLADADPEDLLGYLDEFGVTDGDVSAVAAA